MTADQATLPEPPAQPLTAHIAAAFYIADLHHRVWDRLGYIADDNARQAATATCLIQADRMHPASIPPGHELREAVRDGPASSGFSTIKAPPIDPALCPRCHVGIRGKRSNGSYFDVCLDCNGRR
jgi:hypothetical protein